MNEFHIISLPTCDFRSPKQVRELLLEAERQGHPMGAGSYLERMSIIQIENLVHGRTDA